MQKLKIIENDPWLEPYSSALEGRHRYAISKETELTGGKKRYPILQPVIFSSGCIVPNGDGYSASGRPTLRQFFGWRF
jgi:hypothetical protein